MVKYINCITEKEVKLGETVSAEFEESNDLGKKKISFEFLVSKETLPILIKKGIIKVKKEKEKEKEKKIQDIIEIAYIEFIAKSWNKFYVDTINALKALWELYPFAVISIFYRAVSVDMCKSKNLTLQEIINQDEFYMITFAPTIKPMKIRKDYGIYTKTNNGAFFSTEEEAKNAIKIVSKMVKYLKNYNNNNEQKN